MEKKEETQSRIRKELYAMQDEKYRVFQSRLIPTVSSDRFIGVRSPELRLYARKLFGTPAASQFLADLPHAYFDEMQLHAFLLSLEKDFAICIEEVSDFLPYIDNWATCDQLAPKVFKKNREALLAYIDRWLHDDHPYTVRFGIGMLMQHFLDEDFHPNYLKKVAAVCSEEYYVNMERAWYFATALAKQYDSTIPLLTEGRLDRWTHNKTIQKARESRRISQETKVYLETLRR